MKDAVRKDVVKAIDLALSKYLTGSQHSRKKKGTDMSCCAVYDAADELCLTNERDYWGYREVDYDRRSAITDAFDDAIEALGLSEDWRRGNNLNVDIFNAFPEFKEQPRRKQKARAVWLTWVKLMIEEKVV